MNHQTIFFTNIIPQNQTININFKLPLTAEARQKSRQIIEYDRQTINLKLPRGTVLKQGDLITTDQQDYIIEIQAKPEPVMTVTADHHLTLMKGAYHLGNRHIPLEIQSHYLRLSPDPVLMAMLLQLGLQIKEEIAPFFPEIGAYHHH
jgi:urease accessory protein